MPATDEALSAEHLTFRAACRENTGTHMLDSGFANGRAWQKGDISEDSPLTSMEFWGWDEETGEPDRFYSEDHYDAERRGDPISGEISATLHTGAFLDLHVEIDRELQAEFEAFAFSEEMAREDWFACLDAFLTQRGYVRTATDNVYNGQNDLSAVYVWQVWEKDGEQSGDWIYAEEFVAVYFMHTGADVRGGYGRPVFSTTPAGEYGGDYTIPLDIQCEFYFQTVEESESQTPRLPGIPEKPNPAADFCDWWNDNGQGSCGHSGYPAGEVAKYVVRCFPETYTGPGSGVDVEVSFRYRAEGEKPWDRVEYHVPGDVLMAVEQVRARVVLFAEGPHV